MGMNLYYDGAADFPHQSARTFCRFFQMHALQQFGRDATRTLEGWQIHRSEDVGRIVFALVEAGHLEAASDDAQSDFDRLFEVRELFRS